MTKYGPFAQQHDGGRMSWLSDQRRPIPDQLRRILGMLDGAKRHTYSIWREADPESIVGFREHAGDSFIQAAGSTDGITVEVRLPGADGQGHLYSVGRREAPDGTTVLIPINTTRAVRVFSNEVFAADEAAAIFSAYYLTESVAQSYVLRELDLSRELSERR